MTEQQGYCAMCGRPYEAGDCVEDQPDVFICGTCHCERERDFAECYWEEMGNG